MAGEMQIFLKFVFKSSASSFSNVCIDLLLTLHAVLFILQLLEICVFLLKTALF